jgi:class 3 adenylate cyclase
MPDAPETPNGHSDALVRKLATILSADVAEYSRLMGEDEEGTLRTFRGHRQVFESLVAMHRGRIFNTAGDAILAEFASAVEAVRCATDIQSALRTRNDQLPANRQVRFRIGINLGDVMVQGQDLMGDGVNVAARIQTAAEPGGVCISGSVHDQIRNKLSLSFHSLGEKSFKNIQQPVRTFAVSESEPELGNTPVENKGAPPAAAAVRKSSPTKWLIAAAAILLAGGGYWAYTLRERKAALLPPAIPAVSSPATSANNSAGGSLGTSPGSSPASSPANPVTDSAKSQSGAPPETPPSPNTGAATAMRPAADTAMKKSNAAQQAGASSSHKTAALPTATLAPATAAASTAASIAASANTAATPTAGAYEGLYAGPICFGKTALEPSRCFRAEGTITGSKLFGKWVTGPKGNITMFLDGDVSPSGDLKIEMHSENSAGARIATIDLKGTVHERTLIADGKFRMGRLANISWQKIPPAHH